GLFFANAILTLAGAVQYGTSLAFGISGGVCAVYGFLLIAYGPWLPPANWRQWLLVLAYPALMFWLFTVEIRGITPTGTLPHLAGLFFGALVGWTHTGPRWMLALPAIVLASSLAPVAWAPGLPPWDAAHGRLPVTWPGDPDARSSHAPSSG